MEFITLLIFIGIPVYYIWQWQKRKKETWTGEVVDKKVKYTTDDEGDSQESYLVYFKTTDGKKKKYEFSEKEYEAFVVGDTYEKVAGQRNPIKK